MSAITRAIKSGKLSKQAKHMLVLLCGLRSLNQKLPPSADLPSIKGKSADDLLIELSDTGYILGTPAKYKINTHKLEKFNVKESPETAGKPAPALKTLLDHYRALHASHKRGKCPSNSLDVTQIRSLVHKTSYQTVKTHMELFFREPLFKARPGKLRVDEFYRWAYRKLEIRSKK